MGQTEKERPEPGPPDHHTLKESSEGTYIVDMLIAHGGSANMGAELLFTVMWGIVPLAAIGYGVYQTKKSRARLAAQSKMTTSGTPTNGGAPGNDFDMQDWEQRVQS